MTTHNHDWPIIDLGALLHDAAHGEPAGPTDDTWTDDGWTRDGWTQDGWTQEVWTDEPEMDGLDDPLLMALAGLVTDGPTGILDRITAAWVRVSGPLDDNLYVAFTDDGIVYARTGAAVRDDADVFSDLFHRRFDRPLRPVPRPPAGLRSALRSHRTATLDYDLRLLSPFERAVLLAVLSIPRGQVRPYAWIAHQIGRPDAVRAVGSALIHNPVPVLIPCHRVIRSDGDVGGYVFGTNTKQELLTEEGTNITEIYELGQVDIRYLGSDTTGVVCFPSCPNARRITEAHRQGFRTVGEAAESGYRPCRYCQPVPTEPTTHP